MSKRRVVITGLGMLTPLGNSRGETWQAALAGRSGIDKITRFDCSAFSSQIAGEVKNFEPQNYMDAKEIKKLDLFSQFAVASSKEAWADAKLEQHTYDASKMGCIYGVGIGGLATLERYHEAMLQGGPRKISPFLIPAMIPNLAAGHIGIAFGLRGTNFVVTSACTSATHAIGESYRMIANGVQDLIVTGGSESAVTPLGVGGFAAMKALSTRNDDPQRACRPFDKGRDGFILSEGGVSLVLEELSAAEKRGAKIYAEVLGYGASCDANHITAPCADGAGAVACMTDALRDANLRPEQVQYVNAHGTSTPVGDVAETTAVKRVFGEYANNGLLVSSTKSMTGHLLGAAGAIEAAFCSLALQDQIVPPTINLEDPEETCDLDYVANKARQAKLEFVMSNSFGFGGTNGTIILGLMK